jgi:hypothetical protein
MAGQRRVAANGSDDVLALARAHPDLARLLKGRGRALFVAPVAPQRGSSDEDHAVLAVYDYETDRTLVALVDRRHKTVTSIEESRVRFQLSDAEREDAERIAGEDPTVQRLLDTRPMQPLTRLYFPRAGGTERHRLAIVFIRPTTRERWFAVVDLTEGRVRDVLSRAEFTGES